MRLIGVLDILHGQTVRAVAGQRDQYRPILSRWTHSTAPDEVAQALSETFGLREFYVADLDAILHRQPNWRLLETLCRKGWRIWLDAGFRDWPEVSSTVERLEVCPVIGLETWRDFTSFSGRQHPAIVTSQRPAMFSLDARAGEWLINDRERQPTSPAELAAWAYDAGFAHLLALDLAAVGTGQIQWTIRLLESARPGAPCAHWYAGGGVSGVEDLERLQHLGVSGVLVASALHDGRLLPRQVREFVQV
jgi:phosphoribosylformimino-5-aminoimidazole carboxamide ribotide isomerase